MNAESPEYVLDSFALLAHLQGEPGGTQVKQLLHQAAEHRAILWMCIVNLAEVLYIVERKNDFETARKTVAVIDNLPIEIVDVHRVLAFSAAHIKAQNALSFADAFAVALAKEKNARVITGDPEFESVAKEIAIDWLPRKK